MLDLARTRAVVERVLDASDLDPDARAESLARQLVAEHGAWVAGWTWSTSEGGPVHAWCCPAHSLPAKGRDAAAVERVVAAVREWRAFLERVATHVVELQAETADLSIAEGVERAAAHLLPLVIEHTGHEDAWYATFVLVVSWYLDASGHDPSRALVSEAVSGRFASWSEPDDVVAREVFTEIGLQVAIAAEGARPPPDALAAWRAARSKAFARLPMERPREPVVRDGHERWIREVEHARDPERATRMSEALAACRAAARVGGPLTIDRMMAWQTLALGPEAALRRGDAFAKAGRERYAYDAELHGRFVRALADADEAGASVCVRAARAYLDTCFFHPFVDGNARAARLALDFVLSREGLGLHAVEPVFVVARSASDANGAWALALLLEHLVGPRPA